MNNIKLVYININKNFRNAKELKSAFITTIIGMNINNIFYLAIWYYFGRMVGTINGWKPVDIFGLYAFSSTSYGFIQSIFSGVYNIPSYISTGNLDKYLLTPKSILLKIATSDISINAFGDLFFGFMCFSLYIFLANLSFMQILLSIFLIITSSMVYFAFSLVCMSISFYLMDGENISQGLKNTFLCVSLYHGGVFTGVLRVFFTFVIPSLLLGAVPVEIIKTTSLVNFCLIFISTVFWSFLVLSDTF